MRIFRRIWAPHESLMLLRTPEVCSSSASWSTGRIHSHSWTADFSASGPAFWKAHMPKRRRDVQLMWSLDGGSAIFLGKAYE